MTHDVAVCGAGVAGGAVARRLAAGGARVALIGPDSRPGCEGLSARSRELLVEEGVDSTNACITGPFRRGGSWGGGRPVEGAESLVERTALARALCERARSAGADHRRDVVTHAVRDGPGWRLMLKSGQVIAAPIVVEARGRRGPALAGPMLLAIGRGFRRRAGTSYRTSLGIMDFGWCWWAEQGPLLWVQVIARPRAIPPARWIEAAAAQVPALGRALEGALPAGPAVARSAHARLRTVDESGKWCVGDSALALDPLSGQGVYEALRGARLVAAAIETTGSTPRAHKAQHFVAQRFEEAWVRALRTAALLYRENESRGEFWAQTAAAYQALLAARSAKEVLQGGAGAPFRESAATARIGG